MISRETFQEFVVAIEIDESVKMSISRETFQESTLITRDGNM